MKRLMILGALAALTFALTIGNGAAHPDHPSHAERPDSGRPSSETTTGPADSAAGLPAALPAKAAVQLGQLTDYVHAMQLADYVHAVQMAAVTDYVNAVQQATYTEATARVAQPTAPAPRSAGSVGDCTGFSVPDYIIQRESGGNPNAVNPSSGAIGCSQTLPSHYASGGACAGLDMYSVDGQRQCTYILSDGGTNMAPWAL